MSKRKLDNLNIIRLGTEVESSAARNVDEILPGNEGAVDNNSQRITRGRTMLKELYLLPPEERIVVSSNRFGQPIGPEAQKLAGFLGLLARNGRQCPIHYETWHDFPKKLKEELLIFVQQRFSLNIKKSYVLKSLRKKWKDHKHALKKENLDRSINHLAARRNIPSGVVKWQYEVLVDFWYSEKGKKREQVAKASRAEQKYTHTSGSKSFTRVDNEMETKTGEKISRIELFCITHTKKNGSHLNAETEQIVEKAKEKIAEFKATQPSVDTCSIQDFENELFVELTGKERNGYVRGIGLGAAPFDYYGSSSKRYTSSRSTEEVVQLREELKSMQAERVAEKEELNDLKSELVRIQVEREVEKQESKRQYEMLQSQLQTFMSFMQQQQQQFQIPKS